MTKPVWSGRFKEEQDARVRAYTRSLHLDRRLAPYDIRGSRAHVKMLARQGLIRDEEKDRILQGLDEIEREIKAGTFPYRDELEDIHMNIERRLQEMVGEAGARLHMGRSRNDQVALDLKLFCLDVSSQWQKQILHVQATLLARAQELKDQMLAGWTHLQSAQPLSWGHYLLAFCEMLGRDFRRLGYYRELHSDSPLGAGALAGSTLPLDPDETARELGFASSFVNSYEAVGNRDFVLELLQVATQVMLHVSRLAEDFVYFSSTPVAWIELPDALSTGSSMMPHKKNPDVLELARGKSASVIGHALALTALIKGLPSSYHRDLQQDKEHLFPAVDTVSETLDMTAAVVAGFRIREERCRRALDTGFIMATDLAEYLVARGVPFRAAHERIARLVAYCADQGLEIHELPLAKLQEFAPECGREVQKVLEPASALERRTHKGSTGLKAVEEQIAYWKSWLQQRGEH